MSLIDRVRRLEAAHAHAEDAAPAVLGLVFRDGEPEQYAMARYVAAVARGVGVLYIANIARHPFLTNRQGARHEAA